MSWGPLASPLSTAQAAIWARDENPSLVKIWVICASTVLIPTISSSAMARLDLPWATRRATSRSREVSPPNCCCSARRGEIGGDGGDEKASGGRADEASSRFASLDE